MPELTLTDARGRDAQVACQSVKLRVRLRRLDVDGKQCQSVRILKGTMDTGLAQLIKLAVTQKGGDAKRPIADVTRLLVEQDAEIDPEQVGRFLRDTKRVYVDEAGKVAHAVQHTEEITKPDGEVIRRPKAIFQGNIHLPLRWSGKLIPRAEAARKFVFTGKRQIVHVNGLTYDFLFAIARELEEEDALLLVGPGPKGNQPLILRRGALPYRGFLEGRTKADQYLLILHLSNLELKSPETTDICTEE